MDCQIDVLRRDGETLVRSFVVVQPLGSWHDRGVRGVVSGPSQWQVVAKTPDQARVM